MKLQVAFVIVLLAAVSIALLGGFNSGRAVAADEQPAPPPMVAPVPDAAALETAARAVKDFLRDDIDAAKTPPAKLDLAKSFLQKGIDTQGDPAEQYVLFRMARESAAGLADASLAVQAIDEMARWFQIDPLAMKLETLSSIAKMTMPPAQQKAFADTALNVADDAAAADSFDLAKQVIALGVAAARKARDADLAKQLQNRDKEADALKLAFAEVKAAQTTLDEHPLDADANLAVGRYRAFMKADWDHAVPMLALGSDPKLKHLATAELDADAELDATKRPDEQLKLADAWWEYAAMLDGATRDRVESRATFWYAKALPQLSGLQKLRVEKLLQEVSGRLFAKIQIALRQEGVARPRRRLEPWSGLHRRARRRRLADRLGGRHDRCQRPALHPLRPAALSLAPRRDVGNVARRGRPRQHNHPQSE